MYCILFVGDRNILPNWMKNWIETEGSEFLYLGQSNNLSKRIAQAVYVIVKKVVPDGKGYGKAYGIPVTDGILNTYFEYNDKWVNENLIPNAGTYNWIYRNDKDSNIGNVNRNINDIDNKKYFDMEDRINFGKYKGIQIKDILKMDSDYLIWVNNNV